MIPGLGVNYNPLLHPGLGGKDSSFFSLISFSSYLVFLVAPGCLPSVILSFATTGMNLLVLTAHPTPASQLVSSALPQILCLGGQGPSK